MILIPAAIWTVQIRPLIALIIAQNLKRFLRISPLLKEVSKTSNVSCYKFLALWYLCWSCKFPVNWISGYSFNGNDLHMVGHWILLLASLERTYNCWCAACSGYSSCNLGGLYFRGYHHGSNSFLISSCLTLEFDDTVLLNYDIYLKARSVHLNEHFPRRYFYCFVWGLRNLRSWFTNIVGYSGGSLSHLN